MGNSRIEFVEYDDVSSAVQHFLDSGTSLDDISLRMIREAMGDRGSLTTISKHFGPIKERLERGEAIDTVELTDTDMDALRALVGDIIERRTFLARREKEDNAQAMLDVIRAREADLAMKNEIIDDLEHHVLALEGEVGSQRLVADGFAAQIARLQGMVDALNATIVTLGASRAAAAGSGEDGAANKADQPSAIEVDHPEHVKAEVPTANTDVADKADANGGGNG